MRVHAHRRKQPSATHYPRCHNLVALGKGKCTRILERWEIMVSTGLTPVPSMKSKYSTHGTDERGRVFRALCVPLILLISAANSHVLGHDTCPHTCSTSSPLLVIFLHPRSDRLCSRVSPMRLINPLLVMLLQSCRANMCRLAMRPMLARPRFVTHGLLLSSPLVKASSWMDDWARTNRSRLRTLGQRTNSSSCRREGGHRGEAGVEGGQQGGLPCKGQRETRGQQAGLPSPLRPSLGFNHQCRVQGASACSPPTPLCDKHSCGSVHGC